MLQIEHLSKSYGSLEAVKRVSFQVNPGEIYGLLGPNGAGKTTTISCVCGLLRPDHGRIIMNDIGLANDPIGFKKQIGVVPQDMALYSDLSARENLMFWGRLAGLEGGELKKAVDQMLERVGLSDRAKEPCSKFSGGMKRRLNLAVGMVHSPKLLLLDEPTVGIDIQARLNILDVVREAAADGMSVLYTTHALEEAEKLCTRIGIMDQGEIMAEGDLETLKKLVGEGEILTIRGSFSADLIQSVVGTEKDIRQVRVTDGMAMLDVGTGKGEAAGLLGRILSQGVTLDDIAIQEPGLQNVFLKLTGRELRD
jgi:linearmycin/streptolysin S transport system ATP-binding protein